MVVAGVPASCLAVLVTLGLAPDAAAVDPHSSFASLPSSNGWGVVVYDASTRRVNALHEHVYRFPDADAAATATRDFCFDTYFGIRVGAASTWLTEVPITEAGYVPGTPIVRTTQMFSGIVVQSFYFAPRTDGPALVMGLVLANSSGAPTPNVSLFSIHNFHLGSGRPETAADDEHIFWSATDGTFQEVGPSGATIVYRPLEPPTRHAASPNNPYPAVIAGSDLVDTNDSTRMDDAVAGFQWDVGSLPVGGVAARGVAVGLSSTGDALEVRERLATLLAARNMLQFLDAEIAWWDDVAHGTHPPPAGLTPDEQRLWKQSIVTLLTAQVQEPGPGHGQIVASLPPGQWNIAWVRDMSYAAVALARAGWLAQARDALKFMLDAPAGDYEEYVGMPYRISVTRYFGNGAEESDSNEDGPNIEFDGFGLFLWALAELAAVDDDDWWESYWLTIRDGITDVIEALRDPATGLMSPDSSIWEVHWNGNQKRFAHTTLAAARGLCSAAELADLQLRQIEADEYREDGIAFRDAALARLTDAEWALAQSFEDLLAGTGYRDAAVVEAINWGLVQPDGFVGNATLDALITHLTPPSGRGFFRNDDGGWYDGQEWIFIDLRAANAFRLAGRTAVAADLLAWIRGQAAANYDLIAELHDATTADYAGAVPMVGFGAGAYVIALADRMSATPAEPACGEWPDDPPERIDPGDAGTDASDGGGDAADADASGDADGGTEPGDGGGCGCRAAGTGGSPGWVFPVLLVSAFLGRRRR